MPPTESPTSQPSSKPTSRPTRRDLRITSLLTGDVDAEFVLFKINYYLCVYIGYFVQLILVSFLVDYFECGNETVDNLTMGAFASKHYQQLVTVDTAATPDDGLISLLLWRLIAAEEEQIVKQRELDKKADKKPTDVESGQAGYSSEFYRFLLSKRTYIGCKPDLFPHGHDFYIFNVETIGLLEDLIVYTLNYHKILSTMFSIKGSPHFSRLDRRVVFTMQHVSCLSVLALVEDIFRAAGLSSSMAGLFTQLVIPTLSIALNALFKAIIMSKTMRGLGRYALLTIFTFGAMCLLIFAAMATSAQGRFDLIVSYTVKVFIVSSLQEQVLILLMFYHRIYFGVYLGSFPVLMVGKYFFERLRSNGSGKHAWGDLVCETHSLFGLVTVEWAYSKTQTLMAAAAAPLVSAYSIPSLDFASTYGLSEERVEFQMISFTDNPLHNRAAADLLRVSTATDGSSARDSTSQHTVRLTIAHAQRGTANALLPRPARTSASAQTAAEETDDGSASTRSNTSHAMHEGGDTSDEKLSLQLKRFASPVEQGFAQKVHFFQALEQGVINTRGANVEDTDMAMIEQLGWAAVELQGELVRGDSVAESPQTLS